MTLGYYGGGGYGSDPYGSIPAQIGVQSATALNGTHVQVNFTELLDFTFPPILSPSNYAISPTLTVISVEETSANAVVLTTTPQTNITYTVTVTAARSTVGTTLNPLLNSAQFSGFPAVPGYFAIATTSTRVRAIFSTVMLNDANLSNPDNYTITDFNGNAYFVLSATPEQNINPVSVVLTLSRALGESEFYVCTVSSNIHTATGLNVLPPTSVFQWLAGVNQFSVPLSIFSGEVSGGVLGDPQGLVFFSPALNVSTANSIIQVEDVDVCTTAYDTYSPPVMIDPIPLYTFGGGIVPTPTPDPYLLNQCVLWAPFPRNFEAQINVGFSGANQDTYTPPVDTSCSITVQDQYAYGYVALLNDTGYYLLPKSTPPLPTPPMFITAKNLTPIPPGKETIIVLHVALGGSSTFGPSTAKTIAGAHVSLPGVSQLVAGAGPPPVVLSQASMSSSSTLSGALIQRFGGATIAQGQAYVRALATVIPPPLNILVIQASSNVSPFATVRRSVAASVSASSFVAPSAHVRRGVAAAISPSSEVTPYAHARWAAHAAVAATSSVIADATVVHKAEAFPIGVATVTATAS